MIQLGSTILTQAHIEEIVFLSKPIIIEPHAFEKIEKAYSLIMKHADEPLPIYGINTGFGALAEERIKRADQALLQKNIIFSHAVGVGNPLDFHTAKTLLLLRLNTLAQGYSGASPQLIKNLTALVNADCAPFIPKKGSVGASGDLAPLAHLGLLLLGIGKAYIKGQVTNAKQALKKAEISELELGVRDGLALINGTQAMAASGTTAVIQCKRLNYLADITAASSIDALGGHIAPYDLRIHELKPHPGQIQTAKNITCSLRGRAVEKNVENSRTQDPYSLRCVPQVHGASKDVLAHVEETIYREINSVTDNPLFFHNNLSDSFDILSGGNFHGQHMAFALDYLAMSIAELASISERRLELLVNPNHSNGLPPFLTKNSGLNSGYMMLHVTASALVNENKIQCHPASVDSIPTSASREDHVSMGMTSANKAWRVIKNTETVLAIELMAAHQALDLRTGSYCGLGIQKLHRALREIIPMREADCLFVDDLEKTKSWLSLQNTHDFIHKIITN